jgi:hypothetical protein
VPPLPNTFKSWPKFRQQWRPPTSSDSWRRAYSHAGLYPFHPLQNTLESWLKPRRRRRPTSSATRCRSVAISLLLNLNPLVRTSLASSLIPLESESGPDANTSRVRPTYRLLLNQIHDEGTHAEVGHTRSVYRWANQTDLLPCGPGDTKETDYNSNLACSHHSRKRNLL